MGYSQLTDADGNPLKDADGNFIYVITSSPNPRRVVRVAQEIRRAIVPRG